MDLLLWFYTDQMGSLITQHAIRCDRRTASILAHIHDAWWLMLLHRDRLHLPLITCVLNRTDSFQPVLDDCFNIGVFNGVPFHNKCEERRQGQRAAGSGSKRTRLLSETLTWQWEVHSLQNFAILHSVKNKTFTFSYFLLHSKVLLE